MPYQPAGPIPLSQEQYDELQRDIQQISQRLMTNPQAYGTNTVHVPIFHNQYLGAYDQGIQAMGAYTQMQYATVTVSGCGIESNLGTFQVQGTATVTNNTIGNWQYVETPEMKAEREALQKKWKEETEAADKKARETLILMLDDSQRDQLEKEKFFDVQTEKHLYRIKPGRKVERLDPATKKATSLFCVHPNECLPADDIAISQKLWLETDEATFLKTANETRLAA